MSELLRLVELDTPTNSYEQLLACVQKASNRANSGLL
jgi:hypothetical protein